MSIEFKAVEIKESKIIIQKEDTRNWTQKTIDWMKANPLIVIAFGAAIYFGCKALADKNVSLKDASGHIVNMATEEKNPPPPRLFPTKFSPTSLSKAVSMMKDHSLAPPSSAGGISTTSIPQPQVSPTPTSTTVVPPASSEVLKQAQEMLTRAITNPAKTLQQAQEMLTRAIKKDQNLFGSVLSASYGFLGILIDSGKHLYNLPIETKVSIGAFAVAGAALSLLYYPGNRNLS